MLIGAVPAALCRIWGFRYPLAGVFEWTGASVSVGAVKAWNRNMSVALKPGRA